MVKRGRPLCCGPSRLRGESKGAEPIAAPLSGARGAQLHHRRRHPPAPLSEVKRFSRCEIGYRLRSRRDPPPKRDEFHL